MSVLTLSRDAISNNEHTPPTAGASHLAAITRFAKVAGMFLVLTIVLTAVVAAKVFAFLPQSLH
jgi:hypothetical protein